MRSPFFYLAAGHIPLNPSKKTKDYYSKVISRRRITRQLYGGSNNETGVFTRWEF